MKQKSVGLTLRALIIALALILVAGSPALPPFDGVAYAQGATPTLTANLLPGGDVSLTWTAVTNADSYEVWRGDGSGSSVSWPSSALATGETGTTYTDSTVAAGNTYSYAVRAVEDGTAGSYSNVENITLGGGTAAPSTAPTVTVAADGQTSVAVSWTPVPDATAYQIQFWHAGITDWEQISGDQTSPYTHTGLTAGTQYYYVVRGSNAGGNGPWSNWRTDESQVTLVASTAVPVLTLDHQSRTVVQLSWTAAAGGSRYDLERRRVVTETDPADTTNTINPVAGSTTSFARLPSALLTATSYTDSAANFVAPADTATEVHSVKYEYRVRAVDSTDQEGNWSVVKSVTIPKAGVSLAAPGGLAAAEVTASNIRVQWNNVDGAEYYQIQWKSGDGDYSTSIRVNRSAGATSSYNDTDLSPSTKYTYRVRGVNVNGPGDWAADFSRTTNSVTAVPGQMPKVTGLAVEDKTTSNTNTAGERMVKLTWNAVSNATHYQIQRYNAAADAPAWANVTGGTPAVVSDGRILKTSSPSWEETITTAANEGAGQTYFYVVSAIDEGLDETAGNADDEMGEWSDYKSVTFKAYKPTVPTALATAETSGTSILVSWTAPAVSNDDPHTGAADSYTLEWKASPSYSARTITVNGTSYHHTGLSGTSTYKYRVKARNTGGESAWSSEEMVVLGNTLGRPMNVRAVDATSGTGDSAPKIKVSWSAVTGADGYEIQRFIAGETNAWRNLAGTEDTDSVTAVSGTMVTDDMDNDPSAVNTSTALAASTTYYYRVRTVREEAKSGWSATVSGTTKATAADAPTLVATSIGVGTIRLTWDLVAGATGYEIEFLKGNYATDAAFGAVNLNRSKITVTGGSHRNYVHTGRAAGTRYSYRIRAKLAQGGETGWSSAVSGATPIRQYTKPARPDLSATTTVSTTMTLKWDAVKFFDEAAPGAESRLTADTNYQIQRRVSGSSTWVAVVAGTTTCENNKCTRIDGSATPTDAAALKANTVYYYRIRATVTQGGTYTSYWDYTNQRTSN